VLFSADPNDASNIASRLASSDHSQASLASRPYSHCCTYNGSVPQYWFDEPSNEQHIVGECCLVPNFWVRPSRTKWDSYERASVPLSCRNFCLCEFIFISAGTLFDAPPLYRSMTRPVMLSISIVSCPLIFQTINIFVFNSLSFLLEIILPPFEVYISSTAPISTDSPLFVLLPRLYLLSLIFCCC
jgi:hypothetical protein